MRDMWTTLHNLVCCKIMHHKKMRGKKSKNTRENNG